MMKRIEHREAKWKFPFVEYSPEKNIGKLPLIIQLHGAGERGAGKEDEHKRNHHIDPENKRFCSLGVVNSVDNINGKQHFQKAQNADNVDPKGNRRAGQQNGKHQSDT